MLFLFKHQMKSWLALRNCTVWRTHGCNYSKSRARIQSTKRFSTWEMHWPWEAVGDSGFIALSPFSIWGIHFLVQMSGRTGRKSLTQAFFLSCAHLPCSSLSPSPLLEFQPVQFQIDAFNYNTCIKGPTCKNEIKYASVPIAEMHPFHFSYRASLLPALLWSQLAALRCCSRIGSSRQLAASSSIRKPEPGHSHPVWPPLMAKAVFVWGSLMGTVKTFPDPACWRCHAVLPSLPSLPTKVQTSIVVWGFPQFCLVTCFPEDLGWHVI